MSATREHPHQWTPVFQPSADVSVASAAEQQRAFTNAREAIDHHLLGTRNFVRFQAFLGPPGVGKTHLTSCVVVYALAQGARVVATSIPSETAGRVGGIYVAHLLHLPVTPSNVAPDIGMIVNMAMNKMERDTLKLALLRSTDILVIEELGFFCGEVLHAIDMILQRVCKNTLPFGGILLVANGDPLQLPPPTGRPPWLSHFILLLFDFHYLQHFVRMSDPQGQELLTLLKNRPLTAGQADEAVSIIGQRCLFVDTFADVPTCVLRVLGTRRGEKREADSHQQQVINSGQPYVELQAVDQSRHVGVWTNGARLDASVERLVKEPKTLLCYSRALLRFTSCNYGKRQSQGQLCIVENLPIAPRGPFDVWAAPPGVRSAPPVDPITGTADYSAEGFYKTTVTFREGHEHRVGSVYYRRNQYPVKNFVAATVHKVMGDTLPGIACKVSLSENDYKLWMAEQVYVIVSRVKNLSDIYFVGNETQTLADLKAILMKRKQTDVAMAQFLRAVCGRQHQQLPVIDYTDGVFMPCFTEVPSGPGPFLFYLQSTRNAHVRRIDITDNLQHELATANRLSSPSDVRDQPFCLMAFAAGFADEREMHDVQLEVDMLILGTAANDPDQIQQILQQSCQTNLVSNPSLVYYHCCRYRRS